MVHRTRRYAAALALALLVPVTARAGSENRVVFGSRWWTQTAPEASFREYLDLSRGAFIESFLLRGWTPDAAVVLSGENALRRDQSTRLALAHGVRWQLELRDDQIPHLYSLTARTPYTEVAPGVYRLPDSLQARAQGVPANYGLIFNDAAQNSARVDLGIQTEVSSARLRSRPAPGVRIELVGERRLRSGHKAYGAPFGRTTAIELMEPVRQRTLDGSATATWERGAAKVAATAAFSDFHNSIGEMIFDNPRRLTDRAAGSDDASSQGRLDLYPDNQVLRGSLALGYRLPRRTMFSATFGLSQGTQNDDFLPMTINTAVPQRALDSLPARSLDGKRVRISQDYRLTTRAWSRASGTIRYNYSKDDNQTPVLHFIGQVAADQQFTRVQLENHPFGNTDSRVGIDLDLAVADPIGLGLMVERRMRERTLREVEKDDEDVFGANARIDLPGDASLSGNFRYGDRKLDHFNDADYQNAAGVFIEQPLLRRFDVANRKQTQGGADVSWDPAGWITLGAQYGYLLNEYPDSRYGLTRDEQHQVVAEATVHPRPRVDLSGGYGYGHVRTRQNSNETNASAPPTPDAATDWIARIQDRNVYVFGGADWWPIERKLMFNATYEFTRALASYEFTPASASLPSTIYRRHDVQVGTRWRFQSSTEIGSRYYWEEYDVADALSEGIPLVQLSGTGATGFYLGDSRLDYRAHRFEIFASRRF